MPSYPGYPSGTHSSTKRGDSGQDKEWISFVTFEPFHSGRYRRQSTTPIAYGGFSDIWRCEAVFANNEKTLVAVKTLRAVKLPPALDRSGVQKRLLNRLKKELGVWAKLKHPNVAPLVGFTLENEIAIISPWFILGNISEYMGYYSEVDRAKLVKGVTAGLLYLHSPSPVIVHGDIKPDNVVIDQNGDPKFIDFGLSKVVEDDAALTSLGSGSLRDAGNARWIAPELLFEEGTSRSRRTDMWSFGCLVIYILFGEVPFKAIADGQLPVARYKGAVPYDSAGTNGIFEGLGEELRKAIEACLTADPQVRASISTVANALKAPTLSPEQARKLSPWTVFREKVLSMLSPHRFFARISRTGTRR